MVRYIVLAVLSRSSNRVRYANTIIERGCRKYFLGVGRALSEEGSLQEVHQRCHCESDPVPIVLVVWALAYCRQQRVASLG